MALLTITSRHSSSGHLNSLVLHHSKVVARLCPAPPQHELSISRHGTRVTVTDLFGNMPVRVKHRALTLQRQEDLDREWDDLKKTITELLLAFQKRLKLILFDAVGSRKLVIRGHTSPAAPPVMKDEPDCGSTLNLDHVLAILAQVGYVTPTNFGSWVVASARAPGISVQAAISLQPSPTKQVQFLCFGIHPLHSTDASILYNEINQIFALSTFGSEGHTLDSEDENQEIPGEPSDKRTTLRNKGVNRWPMFVVRIGVEHSTGQMNNEFLTSEGSLGRILDVTSAMFRQFLEQHHFSRPSPKRGSKRGRIMSPSPSAADKKPLQRPRSCIPAFPNTTSQFNGCPSEELPMTKFFGPQTKLPAAWAKPDTAGRVPRGDFGGWSRIKSGTRGFWDDVCSGLPRGKSIQENPVDEESQVSTKHSISPVSVSASHAVRVEDSPNIQTTDADSSSAQQQRERQAGSADELNAPGDEIIYWTNPATKEVVSVNRRTGQTQPKVKRRLSLLAAESRRTLPSEGQPVAKSDKTQEPSGTTAWLDTLLKEWVNPVFPQTECPLPSANFEFPGKLPGESPHGDISRLCCTESFEQGFNPSSASFSGRFTKEALRNCQVVSQVDNKFLLVKMAAVRRGDDFADILVLIDQHAADERCRVEQLFDELCGSSASDSVGRTFLSEPISFKVTNQEAQLFETCSRYFGSWGCIYRVSKDAKRRPTVQITELPTLIAERCRLEPKLAIDMLRTELWAQHDNDKRLPLPQFRPADEGAVSTESSTESSPFMRKAWLGRISNCPKGMIDLLNSRACRTAIMFNDILSYDDCTNLVSRLAQCAFPFQCAHGRPTMVPIVNLPSPEIESPTTLFTSVDSDQKNNVSGPGASYSAGFMETFETWAGKLADDPE